MKPLLSSVFLFIVLYQATAQPILIAVKKDHPSQRLIIPLDRDYEITFTNSKCFSRIIEVRKGAFSIERRRPTGDTITRSYSYKLKGRDTIAQYKYAASILDTVFVSVDSVVKLRRYRLKNRAWVKPFAMVGFGAVLAVVLLPVAAIDKGMQGVGEWALFEAILVGVAGPPIFIATRKKKYDFGRKWKLETL